MDPRRGRHRRIHYDDLNGRLETDRPGRRFQHARFLLECLKDFTIRDAVLRRGTAESTAVSAKSERGAVSVHNLVDDAVMDVAYSRASRGPSSENRVIEDNFLEALKFEADVLDAAPLTVEF